MHALRAAVGVTWLAFWAYWLASAFGVKRGHRDVRGRFPLIAPIALALILLRIFVLRGHGAGIHSLVLAGIGAALLAAGLGVAVWARVVLGRNWGMPMSEKEDPELVTAGPYAVVRHPIYSGLLLGLVGTALVFSLLALAVPAILGVLFYRAASVEERNLEAALPNAYPAYRARTKMLIPFLL